MMIRSFTLLGILLLAVPAAHADGLSIEPGMWEMTSTMQMPMLPQPRVTTVKECMDKSELSMDELVGEGMDPACTFGMNQLSGDTMSWTIDCPVDGGTMHGEWEATSHGDSVTGGGLMTMSVQSQNMEMNMSWEGRRVGACAP
jgi:hypothetical protein